MRILHVTDTFLPKVGGAEIAIDQLLRAMTKLGVDCTLLAQINRGHTGKVDTPYPLYRFRSPQSSRWAGWWIRQHIRRLERNAGRPFDVLIGHHAFPPGYACVEHARRAGKLAIVYPRGGDIYEVSRFRRKPFAWRRLTSALRGANAVVCASGAMEEIVRDIVAPSPADHLVRIPNGVNIEELCADAGASRFAEDPKYAQPFILGLGRTIRRKGFHLLIEAFADLPASSPRLVIAGEGKELDALKAQAAGLGDRVLFTGLVQDADKRFLLQRCLFMVAPSLEESFGNVALEAMACSRPVIASNASGFAEIVREGENGRLVPAGDVAALRGAIADYMGSDLTAQSRQAEQTAQSFSWNTIAQRYLELIESLTARGRGASNVESRR
jgi:glycosyltransferase involved in cell wall biosynthesis